MALVNDKLGRKRPVSDLADRLHSVFVDCKDPDNLVYAEAIMVLRYLGSEYEKVERREKETISEEFIALDSFPSLFYGSADYWRGLDSSEVADRHSRCSTVYRSVCKITDAHRSSVEQKLIDIDAATVVLRQNCEGRPFSIIDPQRVRFRDQY